MAPGELLILKERSVAKQKVNLLPKTSTHPAQAAPPAPAAAPVTGRCPRCGSTRARNKGVHKGRTYFECALVVCRGRWTVEDAPRKT